MLCVSLFISCKNKIQCVCEKKLKLVDIINIGMSLESSTLSITLLMYPCLTEIKLYLIIPVANLSTGKITWYDGIFCK